MFDVYSEQELLVQVNATDTDNKKLTLSVQHLNTECEGLKSVIHEQEQQASKTASNEDAVRNTDSANEGHVWWEYVYHELQRSGRMKELWDESVLAIGGTNGNGSRLDTVLPAAVFNGDAENKTVPGDYDYDPRSDVSAAAHIAKLKENLRAQAIEIASIRQVSIRVE